MEVEVWVWVWVWVRVRVRVRVLVHNAVVQGAGPGVGPAGSRSKPVLVPHLPYLGAYQFLLPCDARPTEISLDPPPLEASPF